jgi:hypothetical protein
VAGRSIDPQGVVGFDVAAAGVIAESGEIDSWTSIASARQVITIGVTSVDANDLHPYVEVAIQGGALLAFVAGEDGEDGEAWLDGVRFPVTGEYELRIRSFDGFDRGGYTVELYDEV